MAAIVQPHPVSFGPQPRPLRLIPGDRADRRGAASVRIRRRRATVLVIALVALVAAMAGAVALGRGAFASLAPAPPSAMQGSSAGAGIDVADASAGSGSGAARGASVLVRPGDTLWTIARRLQPSGDIRPLVDRLVGAHGPAPLHPGERLVVNT